MSAFLYFIESQAVMNEAYLKVLGFEDMYGKDLSSFTRCGANKGPGGAGGSVISMPHKLSKSKQPKAGYYPENQKWVKHPEKNYWIGIEKGNTPKPRDLESKELIAGYPQELEDGNEWIIPMARSIEGSILPEVMALGPKGEMVRNVIPQFIEFSKKAERAWDMLVQDDDEKTNILKSILQDDEAIDIGIDAICLNYNLDKIHVLLLEIISTRNIKRILESIVDAPSFIILGKAYNARQENDEPNEIIKKKEQPSQSGETSVVGEKV